MNLNGWVKKRLKGLNSLYGYILEVGLEYPHELHGLHNDYPLGPEKLKISCDMLSRYCSGIADQYDLGNKRRYVIHYRNLQLYLSLGMKLIRFHRILKFKESNWLKKFTDFNIDK